MRQRKNLSGIGGARSAGAEPGPQQYAGRRAGSMASASCQTGRQKKSEGGASYVQCACYCYLNRRTGRSEIPEFRRALSTGQCAGGLMGPALRRHSGPSVMPSYSLRMSLTCPLRVPVSLTCPLRVPYVSFYVGHFVCRAYARCMSHYFYVSQIRRDIRSPPL